MSFSIFIMDTLEPKLYEAGMKEYMYGILHKCHENRVNIYLYVLNIGIIILFFGIVFTVLYFCYKSKLTPEEQHQKKIREQEYVLSKIRFYKEQQRIIDSRASITGLPTLDERPLY